MWIRSESRPRLVLNIIVIALSLYGASSQRLDYNRQTPFDSFLLDAMGTIQELVSSVKGQMNSIFDHYLMNVGASQKNNDLNEEIGELKALLFEYEEKVRENERLKALLKFDEESTATKIMAQIVAWDASSDFQVIRINKGESSGIELYAPVITSEGLVGYIFRISRHFADVLTILDPNNRIDGIIERLRSHGIIEGFSSGRCLMKYVTTMEPLILGDQILTSGFGNLYPKGLKVGRVSKIERESYGIVQRVEITPAVNFSSLEEVVVLLDHEAKKRAEEWLEIEGRKEVKQ